MLAKQFQEYFDKEHIPYETIPHRTTFTSAETAQASHVQGKRIAKVVVVKVNNKLAMAIIPGHTKLDLLKLSSVAGSDKIEIAHEYEFAHKFPNCETGAMPPFGDLYQMDVYIADSLLKQDWLAFNCGTHSELVKIPINDLLRLVHPKEFKQ